MVAGRLATPSGERSIIIEEVGLVRLAGSEYRKRAESINTLPLVVYRMASVMVDKRLVGVKLVPMYLGLNTISKLFAIDLDTILRLTAIQSARAVRKS